MERHGTSGCVGDRTPEIALSLVRYLQRLHIGLIGWAMDYEHRKLVKDHAHFEPTDFEGFHGCLDKTKASGPSGAGRLLAKYPNN
jgi:endoglucanase